jgi:hypothetical protein
MVGLIDFGGYDAGKGTRGRKCHIVVDAEGLLLNAVVHSAGARAYFRLAQLRPTPGQGFRRRRRNRRRLHQVAMIQFMLRRLATI